MGPKNPQNLWTLQLLHIKKGILGFWIGLPKNIPSSAQEDTILVYVWTLGQICGVWYLTVCAVGLAVVRPDLSRGCLETPCVVYLPSFSFVSPVEILFLVSASVCVCCYILCVLIFLSLIPLNWFHYCQVKHTVTSLVEGKSEHT